MKKDKVIIGLVLLNLGVFFAVAAFLPRASSYGYSGIVEEWINARVRWDIAWLAALGSSLLSTGLVFLLSSMRSQKDEGRG